jgi:hypothetical protein
MTDADVEARHGVTVAVVREKGARFQIERARACRQLSQQSAATMWQAARKFLAVLS